MRTVALLAIVLSPAVANAEGEYGPMFGGALIATRAQQAEVGGIGGELALWGGRFGIAVEASYQTGNNARVGTLGGSARLLLYRSLIPSLLDPREDVELGFELHAIAERAWWTEPVDRGQTSYGGGVVVRLRGGTDFSNILAESRLFLRVLTGRADPMDAIARTSTPAESEREFSVVIGLGAMFGGGDPDYARQFKPRPLDMTMLPVN
jgi:hypothetical protein